MYHDQGFVPGRRCIFFASESVRQSSGLLDDEAYANTPRRLIEFDSFRLFIRLAVDTAIREIHCVPGIQYFDPLP